MTNHFHAIEPCEALKDYVACYYFIKSDDEEFSSRHYSFPHTYNALSIYKNSNFESSPSVFNVNQSYTPNHRMVLQVKKQAPLLVKISGKVDRATILFKDFGINHFINESLSEIMGYNIEHFQSWNGDILLTPFLANLFGASDPSDKGKIIDGFLLQKLLPISLPYLKKAVEILVDFDSNISIKEIASVSNVSLRTFNRNFKDVLGVSPVEYRRIAQFRHSIENKLFRSQFTRLTDIGYKSHFYDQSYFNKIYQKLTGSNPKKFFDSIDRIGDDRLVFQFLKK